MHRIFLRLVPAPERFGAIFNLQTIFHFRALHKKFYLEKKFQRPIHSYKHIEFTMSAVLVADVQLKKDNGMTIYWNWKIARQHQLNIHTFKNFHFPIFFLFSPLLYIFHICWKVVNSFPLWEQWLLRSLFGGKMITKIIIIYRCNNFGICQWDQKRHAFTCHLCWQCKIVCSFPKNV